MASAKRKITNFIIVGCGLRRLHNSGAQKFVREVLDEIDFQHLRDTHPCPRFAARKEMYDHINSAVIKNEPIDYLEFGVFQGESIRHWAKINQSKESRFYGFDSFEGLPETWREGQAQGHFDVNGNLPKIDDQRVKFIKGWFDKTVESFASNFAPKQRLVLHLDADLYSSTMIPLAFLNKWMTAGTLLIFDEFYDRQHEFKAFHDFLRIWKRDYRVVGQMQNYGKVCVELF
jgi:O-methyltransferase